MTRALLGNDIRVNYMAMNPSPDDRPVVAMLHGLATNSAFWLPVAQRISSARPVLLHDLRGHGRTSMPATGYTPAEMADDFTRLLDLLEVNRVVLLAHSFGGSVAMRFATRHPDRVAALILADARLRVLQPTQTPSCWSHWPVLKPRLEAIGISVDDDDPDGGVSVLTGLARVQAPADGSTPVPDWVVKFFGNSSRFSAERWLELIDTTTALEDLRGDEGFTRDDLARFEKPVLAVYGEHSPVMPTACELERIWPRMKMQILENAGHFFPLGRGPELADAVSAFLDETVGPATTAEESAHA